MSKVERENGITIDNRIRVTSDLVTKHQYLYTILQGILCLAGVLVLLYSWIDGLDLQINQSRFFIGTLLTVIIFILFHELPKYRLTMIAAYLVSLAYLVYHNLTLLQNGLYYIENQIIQYAASYYNLVGYRHGLTLDPQKGTLYLLFLMVQFITFVVTMEIYRHYMRSLYLFLVFVFYGTLLALGIIPNGVCLIVLMIVYLGMRTMDKIPGGINRRYFQHKKEAQEINADGKQRLRIRSVLALGAVFLVALVVARALISPSYYESGLRIKEKKVKLQKAITEFSVSDTVKSINKMWNSINPFALKTKTSGGLNSGKLGRTDKISFNGEVALTLNMDCDLNFLYLKGYAGVDYHFDEWTQLTQEDQERYQDILDDYSEELNAETLTFKWLSLRDIYGLQGYERIDWLDDLVTYRDISVQYLDANKSYLYAPYFNSYEGVGKLDYIGDTYIEPSESSSTYNIFVNCIVNKSESDLNSFADKILTMSEYSLDTPWNYSDYGEFERDYRDFVHEVYTRLPSEGLEQLRNISFDTQGYDGVEYTRHIINEVISYLRSNTTYSLAPGTPKIGQDFAEYFLFDAKKGYCSHYATAAVLMLRNYGIPARYVEGYIVTKDDIEKGRQVEGTLSSLRTVDIRDYNAHAWVEVYFDGVGWIPIEVTNGYSNSGTNPNIMQPTNEPIATPSTAPTNEPTITPTSVVKPTQVPSEIPTKPVGPQKSGDNDADDIPFTLIIMIGVAGFLLVLLISLYLRYSVRRNNLKKFLNNGDERHHIIANYIVIERILLQLRIIKKNAETYEEYAKQASIECSLLPPGFEEVTMLALKANFSKEVLTQQEVNQISEFYLRFHSNYYESLSKKQRFVQKYWKVL